MRANPDEDLHVQGYAGIGKSYLLGALMDCLPAGSVLPLARTSGKLHALRRRLGVAADSKRGKTFGEFAHELLQGSRRAPAKAVRVPRKRALAEELGILGFRQYGPEKTLEICLELLKNYCESGTTASLPGTCPISNTRCPTSTVGYCWNIQAGCGPTSRLILPGTATRDSWHCC